MTTKFVPAMKIYEPPMCCDTGCCGPSIDPELLRITATLSALQRKGITVGRYNLTSAPMAFIEDATVSARLREKGTALLPCVTVDDKIVIEGRYPTAAEFCDLLGVRAEDLHAEAPAEAACCCGSTVEMTEEPCCCGSAAETTEELCCCGSTEETAETKPSDCGCNGGCC